MADQPTYLLTLRPTGDGPPAEIRMRRLLKAALRAYGLRCVRVGLAPQGEHQPHQDERSRVGAAVGPDGGGDDAM